MQKKEFIRQLNELVPRPDPVTTEALYRFDRECAESEYMDILTALRVVARNFSGETLQGAYEIIQHQNAAMPSQKLHLIGKHRDIGRHPTRMPPDMSSSYSAAWAASSRSSPPRTPSRPACTSTKSAAGCSGRSAWPWATGQMTTRIRSA